MKPIPKLVVDENGYIRVKLPSGEMLPEVDLIIENSIDSTSVEKRERNNKQCFVTVKFLCEHDLK